jgi:hypothetical protein
MLDDSRGRGALGEIPWNPLESGFVAGLGPGRGSVVVAGVSVAAAFVAGTAKATPPGPPPTAGPGAPPPAWVELTKVSRWLAFSGYCWDSVCVRPRAPSTRTDLPVIRVPAGRIVRIHFGFPARSIAVSVGSRVGSLPAGRLVSWRVARKGISVISATAPGHGTVSYAVVVS